MALPSQLTKPVNRADTAITPENYAFLQDQIYRGSGIVLDDSKLYLIEARLEPIVKNLKLATLNDLCGMMRGPIGSKVRTEVIEAMTTNETLFFRDPPVFEAIEKTVLPELIERRKGMRKLSIWSAAASSGQEAYSLAILLHEMNLTGWTVKVLGTDINHQILERARTGRYLQIEVNRGLSLQHLVKYFDRQGLEWQIKEQVRKMVQFSPFDLRQSMDPLGSFDIIFCRNVLIYFDSDTKKKILSGLRRTLAPNGYLILGSAETTLNLDTSFRRRVVGKTSVYQVAEGAQ